MPLSRERVLEAAMTLADEKGVNALTMRALGETLGVEAMSLYKHVANKQDILDGLIDLVVAEIELPDSETDWKAAMRRRAMSAREVLGRHAWAIGLLETQSSVSPASLRYYDAVIGSLRAGGFSVEMAAHAFWLLDSYIYGHVIQETGLPFDTEVGAIARDTLAQMPGDEYPYLVEMATEYITQPDYGYSTEFEFGLDLILDALERVGLGN